jgi:hypothetical protein
MAGFHFSNYPYDWLAIMVYGHFEHWTADQFGRATCYPKEPTVLDHSF